jgi:hypothetical protein
VLGGIEREPLTKVAQGLPDALVVAARANGAAEFLESLEDI